MSSEKKATKTPKRYGLKFEHCFVLPNNGLRAYFNIVREGQPNEYRTAFAEGQDVQEVLQDWAHHLKSISNEWPSLVNFENDLRSKVGPMSIMKPLDQRMKDIDSYYEDILLSSEPISWHAYRAFMDEFKMIKGLRVRSQKRTIDLMKKSTNSGSPYFTKRRNVVDQTLNSWVYFDIQHLNDTTDYPGIVKNPSGNDVFGSAAVLGWRGQEGGPSKDDVKQRVVWMFPFAVNLAELQVYQPLIEACQKRNLVPAWVSMEMVDYYITRMFDTKDDGDPVICTDFSRFDQHFNREMAGAALEGLRGLFTLDESFDDWSRDVFPIKYMIPLAYDYGKIRRGIHGMGSGSGGTNADETIVHRMLQHEVALKSHSTLNPYSQCLGDDGVLTYPGIRVEDVVESYSSHGQEMNPDKQYVSTTDCVYLRRWHHRDYRVNGVCVGVYSTYRALGRLMEQERFYNPEIWSPEMITLRELSIIENVKWHPLREEFLKFCIKRDKHRLGLDIPGFYDNIGRLAKEAMEKMPDFLSYNQEQQLKGRSLGIADWWVVNAIQRFR